jgi:hypothetical protein
MGEPRWEPEIEHGLPDLNRFASLREVNPFSVRDSAVNNYSGTQQYGGGLKTGSWKPEFGRSTAVGLLEVASNILQVDNIFPLISMSNS